jgi:hypothetical protein
MAVATASRCEAPDELDVFLGDVVVRHGDRTRDVHVSWGMRYLVLLVAVGCGGAPAQRAAIVGFAAPDARDTAARLVAESGGWERVTMEARDKIALCAAMVPIAPTSAHRTGELFHTYVTPSAAGAYREDRALAPGAGVLKRTFDPKTNVTTSYFVMWKDTTGWSYAAADAAGGVLRAGALADCAGCHDKQRYHDFLFHAL